MAKDLYRKLVDKQGNEYAVTLPSDVNAEDITDIMVATHEQLVKLKAYKLAGDVWREADNVECADGGKAVSFYKKIHVFSVWPELNQEDFGSAVQTLLEQARNYRINRVVITSYEGKPVLKDSRGYYLKRTVSCIGESCQHTIEGTQRLSMSDGVISRAQAFVPFDLAAARAREGSKSWLCPACAPRSVAIPILESQEVSLKAPRLPSEPLEVRESTLTLPSICKLEKEDDLTELLMLTDWKSEVPLEYLKGYIHGVLKARLQK